MAKQLTVYLTSWCGYCNAAVRLLNELGLDYTRVDVTNDPDIRAKMVEETGWRTVPIVMLGEDLVGGYTELEALARSGELERRMEGS